MARKPTVLAVDDTHGNLVALEAVLERDFDLIFAESGASAISIMHRRSDVAVILMDVQMPIMDGFEAAKRIKEIPGCEDIPIVFVTAVYQEDPYVKRGYQVGGVDYFTKPFDPDLLRRKLSIYSAFRERAAVLQQREDQIRQTEELMQAGRKLSAILDSLPVGVLIADAKGQICQINDEVSRICRATEVIEHDRYGEVLGWWSESGHRLKESDAPLARAIRSGESSHNSRFDITCFDGSTRTILGSASPLIGAAGDIVGAVMVIKDMTESQRIEEEFETGVARLVSSGVDLERTRRQQS